MSLKLNSNSINYNVATVLDLTSIVNPSINDTVVVTEEGRGGVFIYRADGTSNGGTIFDSSSTGKWHRQYEGSVNVKWFGAKGDGVTDDTTALNNFYVSANTINGIEHYIPIGTYLTTAQLPSITKSNVKIVGEGSATHDVSTIFNGVVIKYAGVAGAIMQEVYPIEGASNQRLSNVQITGIAFNCNNLANYGLFVKSTCESIIEIAVADAKMYGLFFSVVTTLGESRDVQKNRIRFIGRQFIAKSGISLGVIGDSGANFSMNEITVDIQHTDIAAIYISNSDNNDWRYIRTYKAPTGIATECISLTGGVSVGERVRSDRIHYLVCNTPLHAYGTETYAYPSVNNKIYCLDVENGSPSPLIGTNAILSWQKDSTLLNDTAWKQYTPTIQSYTGTITSYTSSGYYIKRGNIAHIKVQFTITDNGTGASALGFSLPFSTSGTIGNMFHGKERALTGKAVSGFVDGGGASMVYLQFYDGTYPGANGRILNCSGFIEVI